LRAGRRHKLRAGVRSSQPPGLIGPVLGEKIGGGTLHDGMVLGAVAQEIARRSAAQLAADITAAGVGSAADLVTKIGAVLIDTDVTIPATIAALDTKIDTIDTVVDRIEVDTTSIESKVDIMDTNVDQIENTVDGLDARLVTLDAAVDRIEVDTTSIEAKVDVVDGLVDGVLARIADTRIEATTVGTGTNTTVTLELDEAVGSSDLVGSVLVWENWLFPPRRITANTAGTSPVVTFTPAVPSAPGDGFRVIITGYVEAGA
jgi:hypothetical protein